METEGASERWYERVIRRTAPLRAGEERQLTAALEAHRGVVARDVLASSIGLAALRDLRLRLAARTLDVRSVIELEADARVEDALAGCLERLARVEALAKRGCRGRTALLGELRELPLRRVHVDAVIARLAASGVRMRPALRRLRLAAEGASSARTRLVESHLRLVVAIARRYVGQGLELPDLVQEGTIGIMRAVERFDPRREVGFSTYAAWWVRQTIGRAVAKRARPVRLPLSVEDGIRKIRRHRREVARNVGRRPTLEETVEATRLSRRRVDEIQRIEYELCQTPLPLDDAAPDDPAGRPLAELLADASSPGPETLTVAAALRAQAASALEALTPREREVMRLRYGLGHDDAHTLEDIGRRLGVTRQRILQIASKALVKLRASQQARGLRTYWDA